MFISHYLITIILGYLIGSILPGFWIGKYIYHQDIRDSGSGNIGTTNTFRQLGITAGTITMIIDILKGTLAASLPILFGFNDINPIIPGIFAVVGHVFSPWIGFKGGKAVATSGGVVLAIDPRLFLLMAIVFVVVLLIGSMVSVSAITTALFAVGYCLFFADEPALTIATIIMSILLIYRHRENIKRIINGNESMVPFGLTYRLRKKS